MAYIKNFRQPKLNRGDVIRFVANITYDSPDKCWEWNGCKAVRYKKTGMVYGHFNVKRKGFNAHRIAYLIFKGSLINGSHIDHLCRNTTCVNPRHLEQVTAKENILRGESIVAKGARKTHCKQGHLLSGENLHTLKTSKHRRCMECMRAWNKKWKKKKRDLNDTQAKADVFK